MPPKRKITKRRLKRSLPPSQRRPESPVNPLGMGLGAGLGSLAGAGVGNAATNRLAERNVRNRIPQGLEAMSANTFAPEGRGVVAARQVGEAEYRKMARVKSKGKVENYNELMNAERKAGRTPGAYDRARKGSGLSNKEYDILMAKKNAKVDRSLADMAGSSTRQRDLTKVAAGIRAKNTRGRNKSRGAALGGGAGAAIALIAQLVAAEMRKKK